MKKLFLFLLLPLFLFCQRLYAAVPYEVTDLRTKPAFLVGSWPGFIGSANGVAIFTSSRGNNTSLSLWRTDGTEAGTYMLRESPQNFYGSRTFDDGVYVSWYDTTGSTLWKCDGAHLEAIASSATQRLSALGYVGQKLFVLASPSREIWVRDGSNVTSVLTLPAPSPSSAWVAFGVLAGAACIGTESGLWRSDGTASGTYLISNVAAHGLTALNGRLVFPGSQDGTGTEFWSTDGTSAGTHIITDAEPGPASLVDGAALKLLGTKLLFLTPAGTFGYTDGSAAGTQVLRRGGALDRPQFAIVGSNAFFAFDDGVHGKELWLSDGTAAGTRMVRDASTDPNQSLVSLTAGATRLYYFSSDASQKARLFESDGTENGTHPVFERGGAWIGIYANLGLLAIGDRVFFTADDGETGDEPWTSDGTDAGTHLITNIANEVVGSSDPAKMTGGGDQVYFTARGDDDISKLWRSDATASGTTSLFPITDPWGVGSLFAHGSRLFIDGGNTRVIDHTAGTDTTLPCRIEFPNMDVDGDVIYSLSSLGWCITNGTVEGTTSISASYSVMSIAGLAGRAYFLSHFGGLLTTDETPASLRVIAAPPEDVWAVSRLFPVRGSLLFFGTSTDSKTGSKNTKLWRFSGSVADAEALATFSGGASTVPAEQLGNGTLLFSFGNQLWRTDGTAAGTSLVHEFTGGSVGRMVSIGSSAIIIATDSESHTEVWATDTTPEGTSLLREFAPAWSTEIVAAPGAAYFVANDPEYGREIWTTDGTLPGTQLVSEILPGTASAEPHSLAVAGDSLFFAATTAEHGTELWALPLDSNRHASIRDARTREDQLSMTFEIRLSAAAAVPVTVSYATEDATAHAGVDYTAATGTVVFAPGETSRSVTVSIANDSIYTGVRYFIVRISSTDAGTDRAAASGVIEEDDISSDLEVKVVLDDPHDPYILVRNNGPAPASKVRICYVQQTYDPICRELGQLGVGASTHAELLVITYDPAFAGASASETDPDSTNNMVSFIYKQWLIASPAQAAAGSTGVLAVLAPDASFDRRGTLTSSDASVVSPVPADFTVPANVNQMVASFSALKAGVATISSWVQPAYYYLSTLDIRVFSSVEEARRLMSTVSVSAEGTWYRGDVNELTAYVGGCTPNRTHPSGLVDFLDGGVTVGSGALVNQRASVFVPAPAIGTHHYYTQYRGDANFFSSRSQSTRVNVYAPVPAIAVEPVFGTSNVRVALTGRAGHTPTGSIVVAEGSSARTVDGALQPFGTDSSFAIASGFNAATRSITISYSGDAYFDPVTQTLPIALRGDPNGDGLIDANDVFYLANYLFGEGAAPVRDADCNLDGGVNAVDLFYLINYVFAGGAAPL